MSNKKSQPKKLKKASAKIAVGIVKVMVVMIGPMALGSRCRNKSLHCDAPIAMAAWAYSSCLSCIMIQAM